MAGNLHFDQLEPPLPPVEEDFNHIVGAAIGPTNNLHYVHPNNANAVFPPVTLVRRDNPQQAYAEIVRPGWPRNLARGGRPAHWGQLKQVVVYPRTGEDTYKVPESAEEAQFAIVKCISKAAMKEEEREDPRKEVARMLEMGDDIHVLSCLEFLEDETHIYIITQKGESLLDWFNAEDRDIFNFQADAFFTKILRILKYLRGHGICHHDISPGNFLFLPDGQLVVFDLAMSIRWEVNQQSGIRHRIDEDGAVYGTPQFMSPEVCAWRHYDGVQQDVWGAVTIYDFLLKGFPTFEIPRWEDPFYRVVVIGPEGGGFRDIHVMDDILAILEENEAANDPLVERIRNTLNTILTMTERQRTVIGNSYLVDPNDRWTLDNLLAFMER